MNEIHYAPFNEYILVFIRGELIAHFDCGDLVTADRSTNLLNE
jgi:hypothetical protein